MKILLVHDFYRQYGGEDAVVYAEKKLLESHNNKVFLYSKNSSVLKDYGIIDKTKFPLRTIFSLRTKKEITTIVRDFRPDVAYIHNVFPLISPSIYHALHSLSVPIVQCVHNFRAPFMCSNGYFFTKNKICERCMRGMHINAVMYRCYKNSYILSGLYSASLGISHMLGVRKKINAYICLAPFSKHKLMEVGIPEEKIHIKPNFIDPPITMPLPATGNYVTYIGRLSTEKGLWTLIKAFERLKHISLKIIGTGPLEISLKKYIDKNRMMNIAFTGFESGKKKWELLRNSLINIVPSEWYEMFSMSIIENYAVAKPVVASDLGALPHVIENNKSGLLFKAGDVDDLISKVLCLYKNPQKRKRMGIYAKRLADIKYGPEENYKLLINIFANVLKEKGRK